MTQNSDPLGEQRLKQLRLYLYFLPVVGFFPALWQLYRRQNLIGDRQERNACQLSVTMMLGWLMGYFLLGWGGDKVTDIAAFRLMFLNALWTSGYFLSCLFLMLRVWQRTENISLPVVKNVAEALGRKYFS